MRKSLFITLILILLCAVLLSSCATDVQQTTDEPTQITSESTAQQEHVHSFGKWVTLKHATCVEYGELIRTCSECGEKEKKVTPKSDEHLVVTDKGKAPTCRVTGLTESSYCFYCLIVIEPSEVIPKLEHTVIIEPAVAATCQKTGLTEGSHCGVCKSPLTVAQTVPKIDHKYRNGVCTMCGVNKQNAEQAECPHVYRDWHDVKKATCTQNGEQMRECRKCGYQETKVINKLAHVYDSGVCINCGNKNGSTGTSTSQCNHNFVTDSIKPPSCAKEGEIVSKCTKCGTKKTESYPKDAHTYNLGVCTKCGAAEPKPQCNHNFRTVIEVKELTCKQNGEYILRCSKCGVEMPKSVTKLSHVYENGACVNCGTAEPACDHTYTHTQKKLEPTCMQYGEWITRGTCKFCGDFSEKISYIAKLDHLYNGITCVNCGYGGYTCKHKYPPVWTVTEQPTCTERGKEIRICTKCNVPEAKSITELPHKYNSQNICTGCGAKKP